jgi:uncharacterized membrane protein YdjX (TVP38/TMEM64 family)
LRRLVVFGSAKASIFSSALPAASTWWISQRPIRLLLIPRPKYRTLDRAIADYGWKVVVLMRLSPVVPFNLQNYALGVTIPFMRYLIAILIGIVAGIAIYVYFGIYGKGLGNGLSILDWVLFGVGVLATGALAIVVTRKIKLVL